MKTIVVLGAGRVGSAVAEDLSKDYSVVAVDSDSKRLEQLAGKCSVIVKKADLSDSNTIRKIVRDSDLVIGALPGFMGFASLKNVIDSGINTVDISFFGEDPFELDTLTRDRRVNAVVDCGVAPGLSNMVLGYHHARMTVESFEFVVGGLPVERNWPYQYKAPFSPIDVLEEYTRPARLKENGQIVSKPALSEPEYVEFEGIGTLEAFNTDGLRTLLKTMNVPNMKEKTLRYPGHINLMRVLRETGFLDKNPIDIRGVSVSPLDMTSRLLFPKWELKENEAEFTVMRINVNGSENGKKRNILYNLFDQYDPATKTSSMARTTGYTCTAAARLILEGKFNRPGIIPPEQIGADPECFQFVLDELRKRNVVVTLLEK